MNNNKVSVVIPVYNSEKFLSDSLNSILNQTYSDYEIICIDDGSTDKSGEILKQYSDKVKIITQKNQGLAAALNVGIKTMKGNWFKWFSPDDMMYPETLEILVNTANDINENSIIYSNWDIIDEKGDKLRNFSESNYNNLDVFDFNVRLLDGQQINVNTTLVPKSTITNSFKMNTSIDPVLIDYDFFLKMGLLHQTKFFLIEKSLIQFRIHENQLSHKKITSSLKNLETVKDEILSKLEKPIKNQYLEKLKKYGKEKPISKKSLESGLKLISNLLPQSTTDRILMFYLNKIRRSR